MIDSTDWKRDQSDWKETKMSEKSVALWIFPAPSDQIRCKSDQNDWKNAQIERETLYLLKDGAITRRKMEK